MCLILCSNDESFEEEEIRKYMERRPQTTMRSRLVVIFLGRDRPPIKLDENTSIPYSNIKPVFERPDSLTLERCAGTRSHVDVKYGKSRMKKIREAFIDSITTLRIPFLNCPPPP
jgi:hypothetical protein